MELFYLCGEISQEVGRYIVDTMSYDEMMKNIL